MYIQYISYLIGVLLGFHFALRYLSSRGISISSGSRNIAVVIGTGMTGSMVIPLIIDILSDDRILYSNFTFRFLGFSTTWGGLSLTTALLVLFAVNIKKENQWKYMAALAYGFPFAWIPIRWYCTMECHHVGQEISNRFLQIFAYEGRLDLGLLELIISIILACIFILMKSRRKSTIDSTQLDRLYVALVLIPFGLFRAITESSRPDISPLYQNYTFAGLVGFCVFLIGLGILATRKDR